MRTACYVIHSNEAESKEYLVRSHEKPVTYEKILL